VARRSVIRRWFVVVVGRGDQDQLRPRMVPRSPLGALGSVRSPVVGPATSAHALRGRPSRRWSVRGHVMVRSGPASPAHVAGLLPPLGRSGVLRCGQDQLRPRMVRRSPLGARRSVRWLVRSGPASPAHVAGLLPPRRVCRSMPSWSGPAEAAHRRVLLLVRTGRVARFAPGHDQLRPRMAPSSGNRGIAAGNGFDVGATATAVSPLLVAEFPK
jgi:hypothetical protein